MGVLQNGFRDTVGVFRTYGATVSNNCYPQGTLGNYNRTGMMRNITAGQGITSDVVGIPCGYRHPGAWLMPQKAGAISAKNTVSGSGTASAAGQSGYNILATITGDGGVTAAPLGLIISIAATLMSEGGITSATTQALASMIAELTGSGDVAATAKGLADLAATLTGSGDMDAGNTALMDITATIRGYGDLTPEGIRDTLWNAAAAAYNSSGTMGEKLNGAGTAGDPWTAVIESGYTAKQILRFLAAHAAGDGANLEGGNPTFKGVGVGNTTTRITATYSAGTRTITSLDGA